jgi:hypothetical protein
VWVHKAHFVCLLAHLKHVNTVINDPVLYGNTIIVRIYPKKVSKPDIYIIHRRK